MGPRLLWHPQQGLYNWPLLEALRRRLPKPLYRVAQALLFGADTVVLWVQALTRRFRGPKVPASASKPSILYIDLGTHAEAAELRLMVEKVLPRIGLPYRAIGFEADSSYYASAVSKFGERSNVDVIHAAVVREVPESGVVRLYREGDGLGNSLYRPQFGEHEVVQAVRLSAWLAEHGIDMKEHVVLLRMNIEGAESDVLHDLDDAGQLDSVDGWFGSWDDLNKTGREDDAYRDLVQAHHVRPISFNGRDMMIPPRLKAIEIELGNAVRRGRARLAGNTAA